LNLIQNQGRRKIVQEQVRIAPCTIQILNRVKGNPFYLRIQVGEQGALANLPCAGD